MPARQEEGFSFAKLQRVREEMGWENVKTHLPDYFDDPAYSRKVLGLDKDE